MTSRRERIEQDLASRYLRDQVDVELAIPGLEDLEFIAQGGMGVVYSALHTRLKRRVALKVLAPKWAFRCDEDSLSRFEVEAEVLARLSHPNIVQVYDAGECQLPDSRVVPYLVMEYVTGLTLRSRIDAGPMRVCDAKRFCQEICLALTAAHSNDVIHGDIKPENILINDDGHCKVADFGVAWKIINEQHTSRREHAPVTPGYVAPEILANATGDGRSDVYSVGILLYELLTGYVPQSEGQRASKLRPDEIDPSWDELIAKATAAIPAARYQSMESLRLAIESLPELPVSESSSSKDIAEGQAIAQVAKVDSDSTKASTDSGKSKPILRPRNIFVGAMIFLTLHLNNWFQVIDDGWYFQFHNRFPKAQRGYLEEEIMEGLRQRKTKDNQVVLAMSTMSSDVPEDEAATPERINAFWFKARYLVSVAFYRADDGTRMRMWMVDRGQPSRTHFHEVIVAAAEPSGNKTAERELLAKPYIDAIEQFANSHQGSGTDRVKFSETLRSLTYPSARLP